MDVSQYKRETAKGAKGVFVAGGMAGGASLLAGWYAGVQKTSTLIDLATSGGKVGAAGVLWYLQYKGVITKYPALALGAVFGFEKIALVSLIYTLATQNNVHAEEITVSNNREEEVSLESLELAGTVADGDGY